MGSVRRRTSVLLLVTLESVSGLAAGLGWSGLGRGGWEPSRQAAAGVLQHHIPLLTNTCTQYSGQCGDFQGVEFSGAFITVDCVLGGLLVTAGCNVVSVSPVS